MITLGILNYASTQAWFITYDIPMREIANCMGILDNITFLVKIKYIHIFILLINSTNRLKPRVRMLKTQSH